MRALFCGGAVLAVLVMAGLVSGRAGASSDDEIPSIKKVMAKLHTGKNAPLTTVKAALKSDSPDWSKVQKDTKVFATLGATLPKSDPPRGDKEAYGKLAKAYASAAKILDESAEKEDLSGSRDAFKKISTSCKACHTSHKGK
jgi:cytochrome c556